jgi:tetratricopeptide (TPR) repeat protein
VLAYRAGRVGEARAAFQQALDLLGDDATKALDGATARWHLAVVLDDPAQSDRRVRLFQEAVQALRRGYPPQHGMVTEALVPYGVFLARMGRFDDARALLREVWDIRRRTLGEDNLLTAEAASALAWCLSRMNRPDEGRRLAAMAGPVLARTPGRRSWWEPVAQDIPGATVAARGGQKP